MKARTLSAVALKTWAVMLLVNSLISAIGVVGQFFMTGGATDRRPWLIAGYWNSFSIAVVIIVAILVLKNGDSLAEWAVGPSDESLSLDIENIERVVFGAIGIYFLVQGLRQLVSAGFELATRPAFEHEGLSYLWQNQPRLILDGGIEFAAGLFLVLGRRGVARLWSRVHSYPSGESEEDQVNGESRANDGESG